MIKIYGGNYKATDFKAIIDLLDSGVAGFHCYTHYAGILADPENPYACEKSSCPYYKSCEDFTRLRKYCETKVK